MLVGSSAPSLSEHEQTGSAQCKGAESDRKERHSAGSRQNPYTCRASTAPRNCFRSSASTAPRNALRSFACIAPATPRGTARTAASGCRAYKIPGCRRAPRCGCRWIAVLTFRRSLCESSRAPAERQPEYDTHRDNIINTNGCGNGLLHASSPPVRPELPY